MHKIKYDYELKHINPTFKKTWEYFFINNTYIIQLCDYHHINEITQKNNSFKYNTNVKFISIYDIKYKRYSIILNTGSMIYNPNIYHIINQVTLKITFSIQ